MREIERWLIRIGLDQYGPLFVEQAIDLSVLPDLRNDDLKELGIPLGHRRRLLRAISELAVGATVLPDPAGTTAAIQGASDSSEAERRQITVLFCDLVGSTQLSTQLDPEDLSALLGTYRRCCAETVGRWDGYVAKYMGDGMLAYFGWPRAHEDDAERAVRAGLELVGAVGRLDPAGSTRLAARVGMATGEVVVGDLIGERTAREHNVVGETPNLAARMQAVARAGTVVIESRTRRLLGNLFDLRSLGQVALKGFADSVSAYEVLRKSATECRFEALHAQQMPLVGREEEIDLLLRHWERAKQGEGQVVMLSGEAGIGKSRACAALLERLADVPHVRLRYFCSPYHTTSPLYPFIAHLERAADQVRQSRGDALPGHRRAGRGCSAAGRVVVHSVGRALRAAGARS
jgi:class 3 adenylate cyclase